MRTHAAETSTPAVSPDRGQPEHRHPTVLWVCCLYLGLSATLPNWFDLDLRVASSGLLVSVLVAWAGWASRPKDRALRTYFAWAVAFSTWACMSSINAWDTTSLYESATLGTWLVFIVPGLAWVLRDRRVRVALLSGLILGATVYLATAAARLAQGKQIFDTFGLRTASDAPWTSGFVLGANRNLVDLIVLSLLPFFLARRAWVRSGFVRLPLIALSAVWVVYSGGRGGLLGLAFVGLVFALIQPRVSRKLRLLVQASLVGLVIFMGIQYFGGQAAVSTNRLVSIFEGSRTSGDEIREVVLNKAWALARSNPIFGVGTGRFEEVRATTDDRGSTPHVRAYSATYSAHNTYASVMAENGFPGLLALLCLLTLVLVRSAKARESPEGRAASSAIAVLALLCFFSSSFGAFLFALIALALGSTADRPPSDMGGVAPANKDRPSHASSWARPA